MRNLEIADDVLQSRNRLAGIRSALLALRLMNNARDLFGDHSALIGLSIIAIASERWMRADLDPRFETLSVAMPIGHLTVCNISSISAATGFNRETTRRKVNHLVEKGLIVRGGTAVMLAPGFTQKPAASSCTQKQIEEVRRAANDLVRLGILRLQR